MKKHELLNKYLSNIAILNVKLHNLHWNVVGKNFMQLHELTEKQYDDLFEKYDAVAELLKMQGEMPLVKMADYLKHGDIQELDGKAFSEDEVLSVLEADHRNLLDLAEAIRSAAEDDYLTVGMMEEHAEGYRKFLWFLCQIRG